MHAKRGFAGNLALVWSSAFRRLERLEPAKIACVFSAERTRGSHPANGFADATAFGLRRLVAAFVRESPRIRPYREQSAIKLAHSKRYRVVR